MREIPLTQGYTALVDDDDFEYINSFRWIANDDGYGNIYAKHSFTESGKRRHIRMHRLVMGVEKTSKPKVDHRDGNTLNNCKSNLRFATDSQNGANRRKKSITSSIYKGVYFNNIKRSNKIWSASINYQNKPLYLGCYLTQEEAAHVYDKKALELFGEFALLNFP